MLCSCQKPHTIAQPVHPLHGFDLNYRYYFSAPPRVLVHLLWGMLLYLMRLQCLARARAARVDTTATVMATVLLSVATVVSISCDCCVC